MMNRTKLAITWAELILVALLVVGGIGIWSYVAEQAAANMKAQEPVEEFVTNTLAVVTQKAEQAAVQAELTAIQVELSKQTASLGQTRAELESLRAAHPLLKNLPESEVISPDVFNAYWEAELNVEAIKVQIRELHSQIESLIQQKAELTVRKQQLAEGTQEFLIAEEEINYTGSQLAALTGNVGELRLQLTKYQSSVRAMESLYPDLANFSLSKQASRYPSSAVLQSYLEALSKEKQAKTMLVSLEEQEATKQTEVIAVNTALTDEQSKAHVDYVNAQESFLDRKRAAIRRAGLTWTLVYLASALVIYGLIAILRKAFPSFWTVLLLSLAALIILIAYQEFQVMGAGLGGLLLFMLVLIGLAIVSRMPQKERPR